MNIFIEILGWVGMLLIVSAFFLVSHGKVSPKSSQYQLMNIAGSLGIGINVFFDRSWPVLALQVVWILVALSALLGSRRSE